MKKRTECVTFLFVILTWPSGLMNQQGFIVHLLCAELSCGIGWQRCLNHSLCPQGINDTAGSWNRKSHEHRLVCWPLNVPEPHQVSYCLRISAACSVFGIQLARALAHSCAHLWHTCWAPVKPSDPVKALNLLTDSTPSKSLSSILTNTEFSLYSSISFIGFGFNP